MGEQILVVEDEPDLCEALRRALETHHYRVSIVGDGEAALRRASASPPDLVLLDIILPGLDGFEVCQRLRADPQLGHIPVIMLTALSEAPAVVRGLDLGADDYVTKPFEVPELLARIQARLQIARSAPLTTGDLVVSRARHELVCNARAAPLTPRELALMELFARRPNQVVSRQAVLTAVWNGDAGAAGTIDVYIARLRRKLGALHSTVRLRTVRGDGFVLDVPVE